MIQKDYFMRMTEILATILAKVLFNKENKNYVDAEKEIESAAKTMVGLDLRLIGILSIEDILKLMKTSELYAGRCLVSAELLREYAALHKIKVKEKEAADFELKSLHLYIEALLTEDLPEPEKYFPKVYELISKLSVNGFSVDLNLTLIDYYEFSGQYSKGEDIIFELAQKSNESVYDKAVTFYKKLQSKTSEQLEAGNFSIEEVNDGLEEILSMKEKSS